jgi:Co/Zn/Cd efflux system component
MFGTERAALALIALITGVMGFIESMAAVPAGSTALAADALVFVQHSISAGFALWATSGTMTRQRWTVQLQGLTMAILGALVVVIAVRRFVLGSIPHPFIMLVIGTMALGAHLTVGAIMLGQRGQPMSLKTLWRLVHTDAVGNVAVIAAAIAVALTGSNIPDLVIGGAMAALFFLSGWRIAISGRLDAGKTP